MARKKKQLNKGLVLGLGGFWFVATTVVGAVLVLQLQQKDPEELTSKAEQAIEQEDWQRAAQFYSRAYQATSDPIYLVRTGEMFYRAGDDSRAMNAYQQAVVEDANLLEAQQKLLDLQLDLAELFQGIASWESVLETSNAVLRILDNRTVSGSEDDAAKMERADALQARGGALLALREQAAGNERDGVESLEQAVELAPGRVDAISKLAGYYLEQGDRDRVESLYQRAIELNDEAGEDAALSRSQLAFNLSIWAAEATSKGDSSQAQSYADRAAELFDEALKFAAQDGELRAEVLVQKARWYQRQAREQDRSEEASEKLLAESIELLKQAIEADPEGFDAYVILAETHRARGDLDAGIQTCQDRLRLGISREGFKQGINRLRRYQLLLVKSGIQLEKAQNEPLGSEARRELAEDADLTVDDALAERQRGPEALHMRGRVKLVQGDYLEAIKWFEEAEANSPVPQWRNQYFLATARLEQDQLGAAMKAADRAIGILQQSPSQGAALLACLTLRGQIELQLRDAEGALATANLILRADRGNENALRIKASAEEQLGNRDAAEATISQIGTDTPRLQLLRAQTMGERGNVDEAVAEVRQVVEDNADDTAVTQLGVSVLRGIGRADVADELLKAALERHPDDIALRTAEIMSRDMPMEERRAAYRKLIENVPDEFERSARLVQFLRNEEGDTRAEELEQMVKMRDLILNRATERAREAGTERLRSILNRMLVLAIQLDRDDVTDSVVELAKKQNLDQADGAAYAGRRLLLEGSLASDAGRAEEAQEQFEKAAESLKEAVEMFPSSGETLSQLGEAYFLMGDYRQAKDAFVRSNEVKPRNGPVLKRLAALAAIDGDEDALRRYLEQCVAVLPDDPWVEEQMLVVRESENPRQAIARREQVRKDNPGDIQNLVRLARLYNEQGDRAAVVSCVDQILEQGNPRRVVAVAANLLREAGEPDRALSVLENYVREAPAEEKAGAQLQVGYHFVDLGEWQKADAALLAAADIGETAEIDLALGQYFFRTGRFEQALKWLDKSEQLAESSEYAGKAEIYRMQAETYLKMQEWDEARSALGRFMALSPDNPSGMMIEAEILTGEGEVPAAIEKLSALLETRPDNIFARFRRAEHYFERSQWQDAIADLEDIRGRAPEAMDYRPRILLAQAQEKVGQADFGVRDLSTIIDEHPEASNVADALLELYIRLGRLTAAENLVTRMLAQDPENVAYMQRSGEINLARFAELKEKGDAPLDLAKKSLAAYQRAAVLSGYDAEVTLRMLQACERLGLHTSGIKFFQDQVPADRRSPTLLMAYGSLLGSHGDKAESAQAYMTAFYKAGYDAPAFYYGLLNGLQRYLGLNASAEVLAQMTEESLERPRQHLQAGILERLGQQEEAQKLNGELFETSDDPAEKALCKLREATIYEQQSKFEEARDAYKKALELSENNIIALNNLAYLLSDKLNSPAEAIPYAEAAAKYAPSAAVLDTLGWAYFGAGRMAEARKALDQARKADSRFLPAAYHYAEVLRRAGSFDEAVRIYKAILSNPALPQFEGYREQAEESLSKAQSGDRG